MKSKQPKKSRLKITEELLKVLANGGTLKHKYKLYEVDAIHFIWMADDYEISNKGKKDEK